MRKGFVCLLLLLCLSLLCTCTVTAQGAETTGTETQRTFRTEPLPLSDQIVELRLTRTIALIVDGVLLAVCLAVVVWLIVERNRYMRTARRANMYRQQSGWPLLNDRGNTPLTISWILLGLTVFSVMFVVPLTASGLASGSSTGGGFLPFLLTMIFLLSISPVGFVIEATGLAFAIMGANRQQWKASGITATVLHSILVLLMLLISIMSLPVLTGL